MCVSSSPAVFLGTTVVVSTAVHPTTGNVIHVLSYANTVKNLGSGPNAMLIHFPSASVMGAGNVVDTSGFPGYIDDIRTAVQPRTRSFGGMGGSVSKGFAIFETGIYTVIMAENASYVPKALKLVPEAKRPDIDPELFSWYHKKWSEWPLALCCFNNAEATQATPMLWWYYPRYQDRMMAPAIDCHTGGVPNMNAQVNVDHWVIVGAQQETHRGMTRVAYQNVHQIPQFAQEILPKYVVGMQFTGQMPNGDFLISQTSLGIERGLLT